MELAGEPEPALALLRAMIGQLVVFHSPDELRIAVLGGESARDEWDWLTWLPHNAHPNEADDAGPVRLAAEDHDTLMDLLGTEVRDRPDHDPDASPSVAEPFVVIVTQRVRLPETSRLLHGGLRNVVLLDATGAMTGGPKVLRLTTHGTSVAFPSGDDTVITEADALSRTEADPLARTLAPMGTSGSVDLTDQALDSDFDLTALLGIRDPRTFDVAAKWRPRQAQSARLLVPLGVTEEGEVVELDIKESAQGGMGPHGLLIGATGSGKSELLRTLVMGLVATHSSQVLNLELVDFKGGATFLGMDRLPHTSAVITNLADEIHLVDRMRDSINGEMIRRQELLRDSGYSSLFDYEKARGAGANLTPLPSLLIIVDEFSELLASKPEFVDLFVSIGRLGRSLGVHLLLASRRLDESRIHKVEGHLSYRIALRTFSSMESRSVIGVSSACELPSAPGNGYLKVDTTNLVRFKAAYVSGAAPEPVSEAEQTAEQARAAQEITAFGLEQQGTLLSERTEEHLAELRPHRAAEHEEPAGTSSGTEPSEESLLEVLIERLEESGPPARQVRLPPLTESPGLDQLLPSIVPDPVRGMSAVDCPSLGSLRVPLGIVDRPFEQLRELPVADLSGADGHIGLVGAPQTGKSTMLRTLMMSLALMHTPEEVQFYCLDFGGGVLVSTAGLPHVGSVATRLERDRVLRTVAKLTLLLEKREEEFTSDSLPTPATLLPSAWTDCLRPDLTSGRVIDFAPGGRAAAFPAGRQLLLKAPDGKRYVLRRGTKYPVPSDATLIALGLDGDRPIAAPAAWLAAVPTGAVLAPAKIDGTGGAGGKVAGQPAAVGQLFTTSAAGAKRSYVMTGDGVAPVSATEAALLAAQHGVPAPREVTATDIAAAHVSADQSLTNALPDVLNAPAADTSAQAVCLRESTRGNKLTSTVVVEGGAAATGSRQVLVPPSRGVYAVDQQQLAARAPHPLTCLVTDRGIAYPLGDSAAAQDLGVGGATPVPLPETLLAVLPRGPVLGRTVAASTVKAPQDGSSRYSPSSAGGSGSAQGSQPKGVGHVTGTAPVPSVSADPSPTGHSARVG
ncbi:type VII secretion protein EccCa [Streptomyces sp. NPDC008222]|uniref:type VII secretion protein EccCa n=1 Tax=Streptomyces sp. NPDC008222 TaxID=3364820 RepID=UPI0036EBB6C8